MATSVADLSINVSANIAQAVESMNRLGGSVGRASDQLESLANVGRTFALGFVGAIAGAFSVRAITDFVSAGINAQAKMQDLADSVGTTASALSSLIPAARLSNTSMDEVAAASAKFSKNLVEVQSGTGAASRAFAAFGLTAKDAARFLQDPVQGMFELSKRSQQFANDGNMAAARMALMGKSASQLAPFLKQLAEQSELTATMTNRQAAAAKALEDQWETLKLAQEQYRNDIAAGLVPALGQLLTAIDEAVRASGGLGTTLRDLAADGTLGIWLLNIAKGFAIVGESVFAVIKTFAAIGGSVSVVIDDIKALNAAIIYAQSGFKDDSALREAMASRERTLQAANERWSDLWTYNATAVSDSIGKQIRLLELGRQALAQWAENSDRIDRMVRGAAGGATVPKPAKLPSLGGLGDLASGKAKVDEFARALESMQKVLRTSQDGLDNFGKSAAEKLSPSLTKLLDIMDSPKWATFSKAQQDWLIDIGAIADAIDHETEALKRLGDEQEELQRIIDGVNQAKQDRYVKDLAGINGLIKSMEEESAEMSFQITLIGKTAIEQEKLTAFRRIDLNVQRQLNDLSGEATELDRQRLILAGEAAKKQTEASLALRNSMQGQQDLLAQQQKGWADLFDSIGNRGAEFIEDFAKNGSSAFKRLWEDFKSWALSALAKIAAQQIVVSIAGSLGLGGAGAANAGGLGSLLGGGGSGLNLSTLSSLFGGGQGGGGMLSGLGALFGGGGLAASAAPFAATGAIGALGAGAGLTGGAFAAAAAPFAATGAIGAAGAGAGVAAAAPALAAVPVVGWIALAALAAYAIFSDNEPSETKGRIGIKPPGTTAGFEDEQSSASALGQVGFLDVDTMYFSGEVAKVMTDMLGSALDAFAMRMDTDGTDRLAKILQETTFKAFEGELSTEDFLNKFGGEALQQVVEVAFQELEPALAAVVRGFSGTAVEVGNFSNTLLGVYDATQGLGDEVRANILGALDSTQETADKVLAFAAVLTGFGDAIEGLAPQLEALDPASIIAFVDALGGAQLMAQQFAFLTQNFLADSERLALASGQLTIAFEAVGLTVDDLANAGLTALPKTHAEFLRLLNGFDLTTEAGRDAYASVLALSQAFVAINGTAQQAAQATLQQAEANRQLIETATEFFGANFYSPLEQASETIAAAMAEVDAAAGNLGVTIPRSLGGFRALVESIDTSTDAGRALFDSLIVLAPAIYDINTAMNDVAGSVNNASDSLGALQAQAEAFSEMVRQEAATEAQSRLGAIDALAGGAGDIGDQLALKIKLINEQINLAIADLSSTNPHVANRAQETLKQFQVPIAYGSSVPSGTSPLIAPLIRDLARFTILEAQFDSKRAEGLLNLEKWYAEQQSLLSQYSGAQSVEALAALASQFKTKWDEIVTGTSGGVDGTIGELERLRKSLAEWLQSLTVGDLSPMKPLERLDEAKRQFDTQFGLAAGGDTKALGDITKYADQYLQLARDLYKSSETYTGIFDFVTMMVAQLAGTTTTGMPYPPELPPRAGDMHGDVFPGNGELTMDWESGGAALAAAIPANGARLASSEDMMAIAKRVDAVVDAIAASADANTSDLQQVRDELQSVRRTVATTFETLK